MLVVISKWKVTVSWLGEEPDAVFYIGDIFYQNVLKKVAEIEWAIVPHSILIERHVAATDPLGTEAQFTSNNQQQSQATH